MRSIHGFRAASLLCLATLGICQTAPQAEVSSTETPLIFRSGTNVVPVTVVVRDSKGHAIGNLNVEDFQLFDNGKPQMISKFSIETLAPEPDTSACKKQPLRDIRAPHTRRRQSRRHPQPFRRLPSSTRSPRQPPRSCLHRATPPNVRSILSFHAARPRRHLHHLRPPDAGIHRRSRQAPRRARWNQRKRGNSRGQSAARKLLPSRRLLHGRPHLQQAYVISPSGKLPRATPWSAVISDPPAVPPTLAAIQEGTVSKRVRNFWLLRWCVCKRP